MQSLEQRVSDAYPQLKRQERRLADFVLDHLDDLATYNSIELAELCEISKATVSRFFKRLGYASFRDVRENSRNLRQSGIPLVHVSNAGQKQLPQRHLQREINNLQAMIQSLEHLDLDELLQHFLDARRVIILGFRNSYPVALHLRQQLLQVRNDVLLLPQPGQSLAEELVDLQPEDLVILVGFRRRPAIFPQLISRLVQQQLPLLLLSEPSALALGQQVRWWLPAPLDSVSAFDSYAAPMSLVNLLVNSLLHLHLQQGRRQIHKINQAFEQLDELSL